VFIIEHPEDPGPPFPSIFASPEIEDLRVRTGAVYVSLCQCRYGSPSKKPTRLLGTAPGLPEVCLQCNHSSHALILKGVDSEGKFFTAAAQQYAPAFNEALAKASLKDVALLPPTTAIVGPNGALREPPGLEGLAKTPRTRKMVKGSFREPDHVVGDVVAGWGWKETFRLACLDDSHINIKELRAAHIYFRRRAKGGQRGHWQRVILLCDSRVVVGAITHGRSPSKKINNILRKMLPTILAGGLYPIMLWLPSGANPADPPSRGKSVQLWLKHMRRDAKARRSRAGASLF
jgi:hypothetical protein